MAEQKKPSAGSTTAKRNTQKRAPAKTTQSRAAAAKKTGAKRHAPPKPTAEEIRQRNQVRAVVLFACAIFFGCLTIFQGDSLWKWAHNAILGLFGGWAMLWPVLMIYVAVITTLDRPMGSISGKVWLTAVVILLFCATGFIFGGAKISDGLSVFDYITALYRTNAGVGGGVMGGLL